MGKGEKMRRYKERLNAIEKKYDILIDKQSQLEICFKQNEVLLNILELTCERIKEHHVLYNYFQGSDAFYQEKSDRLRKEGFLIYRTFRNGQVELWMKP